MSRILQERFGGSDWRGVDCRWGCVEPMEDGEEVERKGDAVGRVGRRETVFKVMCANCYKDITTKLLTNHTGKKITY